MRLTSTGNLGSGTNEAAVKLVKTIDGNIFRLEDSDGTCNANPEFGSVSWTCTSDLRLKTNIRDPKPVLNDLMKLRIDVNSWKLIKAIQELKIENEALKVRIEALELRLKNEEIKNIKIND